MRAGKRGGSLKQGRSTQCEVPGLGEGCSKAGVPAVLSEHHSLLFDSMNCSVLQSHLRISVKSNKYIHGFV